MISQQLSARQFPPLTGDEKLLKAENCEWQAIVDQVHDRWQETDWSVEQMLHNCTQLERAAMIFAKLNFQVENGGFSQWCDNGYLESTGKYLAFELPEMGPASVAVFELVSQAKEIFEDAEGCDDDEYEGFMNQFNSLDREFYELQNDWHEEVYKRLAALS